MKIALASDHAGFKLKLVIAEHLRKQNHSVEDFGPANDECVDYPDFAEVVARSVAGGEADYGILICGTGIGMAIAANKITGIRAVNATAPVFAEMARAHNNAQILTLSARYVESSMNIEIIDTFLTTPFKAGRHEGRVEKISKLDLP